MVRSSQDDGIIETNCVITVIGQRPSDVHILWRFTRGIVVIDTGNWISLRLTNISRPTATVATYFVHDAVMMENLLLLCMFKHMF